MTANPNDKRQTKRITCSLPVRLRTRSGWIDAEVADASRNGLQIKIADAAVGLRATTSLLEVARRLGGMLPESIEARLGPTGAVTRFVQVARIGKRNRNDDHVHLGVRLEQPFSDEDVEVLELILPQPGESWEQAERRVRSAP